MKRFHFTDPFPLLPRLERKIIELRCLEAALCLYFAEELKAQIVGMVSTTDRLRQRPVQDGKPRVEEGQKNAFKRALSAMVEDGAISGEERLEISNLVNFRNDIGHRLDQLFSDLEQSRFTATEFDAELREKRAVAEFDHKAVKRFDAVFRVVERAARSGFYAGTFRYRGHLLFSSSEKVLRQKIGSIRRQMPSLIRERKKVIKKMNSDLPRAFEILENHGHSQYNLRFPNGRMTHRGVEICYRLFDADICSLVIAQLFEMKLPSIRARHKKWLELGGKERLKVEFESLSNTIVPSQFHE